MTRVNVSLNRGRVKQKGPGRSPGLASVGGADYWKIPAKNSDMAFQLFLSAAAL